VLLEDANDLPHLPWLLRVARREDDVRLFRHHSAIILGSLKAGKKERPSEAKANAARRNGLMPCRAGLRRGRPRHSHAIVGNIHGLMGPLIQTAPNSSRDL